MREWMGLCAGILAASTVALTTEAYATGEISCGGEGVGIDLLVGHLDVLSIARAVITIGDKEWSSTPESWPGIPIVVGQAFEDENHLLVDITDDNVASIIGRLRVFKATEGDQSVVGGVFTWKDHGAFVVNCSEPR
ncbi:MAG: hypothetical protein M9955_20930 [Rhizobiaceae bacterium]|jgi:hypothetical protein|nr:hypothetical protein [Rhizobiaceae bacterium]